MLWALMANMVPNHQAGMAIGFGNTVGQLASAASGVLYGALLDRTGSFSAIWLAAGACALACALGTLPLLRASRVAAPAASGATE